jgi:hypothetical protein
MASITSGGFPELPRNVQDLCCRRRQSPEARGLTAASIVGQSGSAAQADSAGEFATALRTNHGSRRIIRTPKWDNNWLTAHFVMGISGNFIVVTRLSVDTCTRQGSNLQPCGPKSGVLPVRYSLRSRSCWDNGSTSTPQETPVSRCRSLPHFLPECGAAMGFSVKDGPARASRCCSRVLLAGPLLQSFKIHFPSNPISMLAGGRRSKIVCYPVEQKVF